MFPWVTKFLMNDFQAILSLLVFHDFSFFQNFYYFILCFCRLYSVQNTTKLEGFTFTRSSILYRSL